MFQKLLRIVTLREAVKDWTKLERMMEAADSVLAKAAEQGKYAEVRDQIANGSNGEVESTLGVAKSKVAKPKPFRVPKGQIIPSRDHPTRQAAEVWMNKPDYLSQVPNGKYEAFVELRQIFELVEQGAFQHWSYDQKRNLILTFNDMAAKAGFPTEWVNSFRGRMTEVLFTRNPWAKRPWFKGGVEVARGTPGATEPDYPITHKGENAFTEWVNIKSDFLTAANGTRKAMEYLRNADGTTKREALELPPGDKYSLHFIFDPGKATRDAMLAILLADGTPIYRVKFGETWYDRTNWKP